MCAVQYLSLVYFCIVRIFSCQTSTEHSGLRPEERGAGCPSNESVSNITRNGSLSIFQGGGDWLNETVVNISDNADLHCPASNVYPNFLWKKTGSEDSLGTTETLQLRNVSLWDTGSYICFFRPCEVDPSVNIPENRNRTIYVQVNGPPLFIFPFKKKYFHVASGQPIQFTITVGSSPPPVHHLTVWTSGMNMRLVIDVDFKRTTSSSVMEEMNVKVPDEMPVYSADVKLTNITWSSTGDYVLFVNNSYGYISYDFFVNVYKPDEVPWWRSNTEAYVGVGVGVLLFLTLVVGTIVMCRSRYKQKILQETVKTLEILEAEKKGSMDSLDILGLDDENKGFDNISEEVPYHQLQSLNTFNNPEET
ncbi:uncharacterized protein LOC111127235 isoform X1 [Crassostrea virginica]